MPESSIEDPEPPSRARSGSCWLVARYYAYRATGSAGFYLPVSILYLRDQGFGLAFVGLAQATFSFAMLAAEIPTGYLGDRIGRRASLAAGNLLRASAMAGYALADAPVAFLAIQAVWATGWAFRSGTQDAWLYELLRANLDESAFARIEGRGSTVLLATSAGAALSSGLLYGLDPAVPFVVNAALATLGLPLLATFPAAGAASEDAAGGGATRGEAASGDATGGSAAGGDAGSETLSVREAVRILRLQAGRPEVRWLVAYAALFGGLFSVTRWLEQPALRELGVPVTGFGVLYAAFKLVSAGAASTAGWFGDRLGARRTFALLVPVYGVAYASVALAPWLLVPVLFLNRSRRILTRPIRNQYLNDRLEDVGRATVLSGASMVLSLAGGLANVVGGAAAQSTGPLVFLPATGVTVAAAGGLLWVLTSPVRAEGTATGEAGTAAASD